MVYQGQRADSQRAGYSFVALVTWLGLSLLGTPAAAQGYYDNQAMTDRLSRIEQDLKALQRSVYRGEVPAAAAPGDAGEGGSDLVRLQRLEETVAQLRGQLEVLQNENQQLKQALNAAITDFDARLGGGGAVAPATDGSAGGTGQTLQLTPPGGAGAAAPATTGDPQQDYTVAQAAVSAGRYDEAIAMFAEFLQAHPKHELAGNAYFWMGEAYFNKQDYQNAAGAYAKGGQNFPKGNKAPDTWLKFAQTLEKLGKKQDACTAYNYLLQNYPKANPNIRRVGMSKKKLAGCR